MSMPSSSIDTPPGLNALFDLSFTRFITVSVIRIIYVLAMVLIALGWIGIVLSGFSQGFLGGLVAIIVATIVGAIYLLMVRVWLELVVVLFRIGENTSAMARQMGASLPTGGFPITPIPPAPPSM